MIDNNALAKSASNKKLAEDLASKIAFQPLHDLLLVKPLKPVMITKLVPVPPAQQPQTIEEAEKAEPTEPQRRKVEANMRKGIILKLGPDYTTANPANLAVGDVVVYPAMSGIPYELLKDSKLIRRYEVVGVEK